MIFFIDYSNFYKGTIEERLKGFTKEIVNDIFKTLAPFSFRGYKREK